MLSGCPEADQNQWRGAIDPPGSVDPSRLGFTQCQWLTDGRLVRYTQLYVDMSLL